MSYISSALFPPWNACAPRLPCDREGLSPAPAYEKRLNRVSLQFTWFLHATLTFTPRFLPEIWEHRVKHILTLLSRTYFHSKFSNTGGNCQACIIIYKIIYIIITIYFSTKVYKQWKPVISIRKSDLITFRRPWDQIKRAPVIYILYKAH